MVLWILLMNIKESINSCLIFEEIGLHYAIIWFIPTGYWADIVTTTPPPPHTHHTRQSPPILHGLFWGGGSAMSLESSCLYHYKVCCLTKRIFFSNLLCKFSFKWRRILNPNVSWISRGVYKLNTHVGKLNKGLTKIWLVISWC